MAELNREDFMEGLSKIVEAIPKQKPPSLFSISNVLSAVAVTGLAGMFNYVSNQATVNTSLSETLIALTARVDGNESYIKVHEPQIEHRDTRQCGHSSKQDLAIANIHNAIKRMSENNIDLQDVPQMNCGPGAGSQ